MQLKYFLLILLLASAAFSQKAYYANPSDYQQKLSQLDAGDSLILAPGDYTSGLNVVSKNGTPDSWIVIEAEQPHTAVIVGRNGSNSTNITNSSYVKISGLKYDGKKIPDIDAIKASGSNTKWTAHIWIDNNIIVGHDGTQQTCGISTKIPSWDWTISRNQILEAGTGLYLGNSDGSGQFVYGIIEYNFVSNPVGYCMQIKHQNPRDGIYGIPAGNFNTVVRHNVFTKNDRESPDGDRPNLLIGGQPFSGIGVDDRVEVYGNFFYGNPREYLMQATGNLSIHNNIFINCAQGAVNLRQHNSRDVKELYVYCNTVYGTNNGIMLWNQAPSFPKISVCNAVFCAKQFNMLDTAGNIYGVENDAGAYFNEPDLALDRMDFYPKNKSDNIIADLQQFAKDSAWSLDFNGNSQIGSYYGAYSGFGSNPGWKLALEVKKIENHTLVRDEDITVETPAVNVYPNPVESVLCFDLSEFPPGEINIKIFDINGKCLIKNKFESFTDNIIIVDIVSLLPGIYEYSITNEKNSCCGKFVKH